MADTRTLKLSLLADVDKFVKGMDKAEGKTDKLNKNVKNNSRKMAKAFGAVTTAVGLMAIAIGVDAVKAVAEDEVSQTKFRENLKNTAGIIDETVIQSMGDYIEKIQYATGFSDNELRDALGRLNISTGDVADSQIILNTAMDTARGTGKPLSSIVDALAKAYDGNYTPLRKMGIKLDENTIKTKDFEGVTKTLTDLFGGNASAYAETYQGKLDIVNERLGELKEAAGAKLVDKLAILLEKVNDVAKGFAGEDPQSLSNRARELAGNFEGDGATSLGGSLKALSDSFGKLFTTITNDDDESATGLQTLAEALENVANGINAIADAYKKARDIGGRILDFITIDPGEGPKFADSSLGKAIGYTSRAAGGSVMANQPVRVGEFGPEMFYPSGTSGSIRPAGGGGGVTIIMNGVVDGESGRRSIERLLQNSSKRTGLVNLAGSTL